MSKSKGPEKIFLKLRDLRKEKGLTLASLAEKSGIDHQKIGRVERGETPVTLPVLKKLADVLQVPVTNLLKNSHDDNYNTPFQDSVIGKSIVDLIPTIYKQLEELFTKHNINVDSSAKVHLAAIVFKEIRDIQTTVQDDVGMVKVLFQVFDAIFERMDLEKLSSNENI